MYLLGYSSLLSVREETARWLPCSVNLPLLKTLSTLGIFHWWLIAAIKVYCENASTINGILPNAPASCIGLCSTACEKCGCNNRGARGAGTSPWVLVSLHTGKKHFEMGFHLAQADLELIMKPRMTLSSWRFCLRLSSAEITSNC